jgi:hypothetical protein
MPRAYPDLDRERVVRSRTPGPGLLCGFRAVLVRPVGRVAGMSGRRRTYHRTGRPSVRLPRCVGGWRP